MVEGFKSFVIDVDIPSGKDEDDVFPEDRSIAVNLLYAIKRVLKRHGIYRYCISIKKLIVIDDGTTIYEEEILEEDTTTQKSILNYTRGEA